MTEQSFRAVNEIARPVSIEEPLNAGLVHPVGRALLPLAVRVGIAPNAISISGIGFGLLAAFAYQDWRDWRFATLGLLAMLGWHVMDGLDGMVARATGRATAFGRFLDGICDYSVFFMVYLSLVLASREQVGEPAVWILASLAGAAHAFQSAYYEAHRSAYIRRRRGVFEESTHVVAGGWLEGLYNKGQSLVSGGHEDIDRRLRGNPHLQSRYFERLTPVMRASNVLGPTGRTLGIWIACIAGAPWLYWVWEVVVLSALALAVERWRARTEAAL